LPGDRLPPIEGGLAQTGEAGTLSATGQMVSLENEAKREGLSVDDEIKREDANLRQWMARCIVWTFIGSTIVTLLALGALVCLDQSNLDDGLIKPGDRIIDHQVIMSLLAATTVQIGTIAVIIARYLFPSRSHAS
jgi:hypothetical protein